jgi:hypothetical protein
MSATALTGVERVAFVVRGVLRADNRRTVKASADLRNGRRSVADRLDALARSVG